MIPSAVLADIAEDKLATALARIAELSAHRKQWRRIASNYYDVATRALRALEIHDGELADQLRATLATEEVTGEHKGIEESGKDGAK